MGRTKVNIDLLDSIADNWDALDSETRARLIERNPSLYFAMARLARWWQVARGY